MLMSIEIDFVCKIDSDLNLGHVAFDLNMILTLKFIVQLTLLLKKLKFIVKFTFN